ncbi:zinc ribbon domain-containing protein [Kitasatospora sp. NPDC051914]|uniref:Zn-ribbon domain-containing OB-fold protein n=1 Tax=Kitasatospora sp. NPDC051914 TaxID=3154945 RepID=UPI0034203247
MNPVATTTAPAAAAVDDRPAVELVFRRCRWCRAATAPVRMLCPVCGSADLEDEVSGGTGTVRRLLPAARRGPGEPMPYMVALDEGFTVQAAVTGALPGAVQAGARVELSVSSGQLIAFRLVAGQPGPAEPESLFAPRPVGCIRQPVAPAVRRAG